MGLSERLKVMGVTRLEHECDFETRVLFRMVAERGLSPSAMTDAREQELSDGGGDVAELGDIDVDQWSGRCG
ncbi:hypothetical protein [Nocardioides albertanoniae]|uniref:hypothetical protein n=1 Tax=Nocardioides albertanoniae TaxID=1175486 RepID=UPI001476A1E0|nr:hypothetical protein [Nocardioides albertanoniae]